MKWRAVAIGLLVLAIASSAVHPFGLVKEERALSHLVVNDLTIPIEARTILERSCMDCHSNNTLWPWYSHIPPVMWVVERDVRRGRDRLNFSDWSQRAMEQRRKLLADIVTAVENREMPPRQYTIVHRAAKLSDADKDVIYRWARLERRKLSAPSSPQ